MIFEDPFTGMPIIAAGVTLEQVFLNLSIEEPPVHDSETPEECTLCAPLLREAIVADAVEELDEWTRLGTPINWPAVEPGPITDESERQS